MAPRKRSVGSRARKRRRGAARSHHHPELIGLGLLAAGVFLACVLWFGLSGGPVAHAETATVGWAAYLAPLVAVPVGALIVTRSALVSLRPFRLGLSVGLPGLQTALGTAHGGAVGRGLEWVVALAIGSVGSTILGVLLAVVGALLLTGASLGAIVRRSGHAVRSAHTRVRRPSPRVTSGDSPQARPRETRPVEPPVDVAHDYPDLVSSPAPLPVYDGA